MSCEFVVGNDGKLQLGLATTWGTKAATSIRLPLDTEGLKYTPNYGEAKAKVGNTLTSRVEILSEHVEGDITTWVTPDELSLLLYAALGKEYTTIPGPVADTYKHYFTMVKSGSGLCLPILSAEIDRLKEVMTYDSLKIGSLSFSASKEDYVTASISLVGRDETDGGAMTAGVKLSPLEYFKFRGAKVYADVGAGSVEMTEVSKMDFAFENNLASDRYTSNNEGKLSEVNPGGRSATLGLSVYLSDSINAMRKNIFKTGATMSVELTFTIGDMITGTTPYEFGVIFSNLYLTEVPYNLDSSDELEFDLSFMVADHDDVDHEGNGTGLAGQTITVEVGDIIASGTLVRVLDEDGVSRVFKYIGASTTAVGTTITFVDDTPGEDDLVSIFLAGNIFNDTHWEMAEGVVAYTIDGNDSEQA